MGESFFERPILNSPYDPSRLHNALDRGGHPPHGSHGVHGHRADPRPGESIIVRPDVAEAHRPKSAAGPESAEAPAAGPEKGPGIGRPAPPSISEEKNPTRFVGKVMTSPDRPAKDMHQVVDADIEQLTTMPGGEMSLRLEIDAELPSGLDRAKRALLKSAATLGFIGKVII